MNLYEVTNGWTGESYVRVYVWSENESRAKQLAKLSFANDNKASSTLTVVHLFSSDAKEFSTKPCDAGWKDDN